MVKIGFATDSDKGLEARIADRFGRAPYFIIVDYDKGEIKSVKSIKNPGVESQGGAGVKSVEALLHEDVKIAVGPNFGPNARAVMEELGIKPVTLPAGTLVKDALHQISIE